MSTRVHRRSSFRYLFLDRTVVLALASRKPARMSHALFCFLQMMDGGTVIAAAGFDAWGKKWALGHREDAITRNGVGRAPPFGAEFPGRAATPGLFCMKM